MATSGPRGWRMRWTGLFVWFVVLAVLTASWQCEGGEELPEPIHTIYLPAIYAPSPPALKGVCGFAGLDAMNASWTYSWRWQVPEGDPRYVPMIRDMRQFEHLAEAVKLAEASGWLMGFNEPDLPPPPGSSITPREGAIAWRSIENAAQGIKLLSPATSQDTFDWLWRMVAEYERLYGRKPRFDAVGVHYYGNDPQAAKDFLIRVRGEALARGYDVPLWLTEFAGYCTLPSPQNGNERMMRELIPWMRQQPWIARFSWFMSIIRPDDPTLPGFVSCSLLDYKTKEPTTLGKLYGGFE